MVAFQQDVFSIFWVCPSFSFLSSICFCKKCSLQILVKSIYKSNCVLCEMKPLQSWSKCHFSFHWYFRCRQINELKVNVHVWLTIPNSDWQFVYQWMRKTYKNRYHTKNVKCEYTMRILNKERNTKVFLLLIAWKTNKMKQQQDKKKGIEQLRQIVQFEKKINLKLNLLFFIWAGMLWFSSLNLFRIKPSVCFCWQLIALAGFICQ